MFALRIIVFTFVLPITLVGCSGSLGPMSVKPDPRTEVIEPIYRVATELRSAQEIGMNRRRFGELLEKLATELSLARDKADSPKEQRMIQGYAEVLQIYKDAAAVWDVKISVPEIKDISEQQAKDAAAAGSTNMLIQNMEFQFAVSEGIPLNLFRPGSTGIDGLVTCYQLPVTDTKGWKTIPNDSVSESGPGLGRRPRRLSSCRRADRQRLPVMTSKSGTGSHTVSSNSLCWST
jgi:hypothetical protein